MDIISAVLNLIILLIILAIIFKLLEAVLSLFGISIGPDIRRLVYILILLVILVQLLGFVGLYSPVFPRVHFYDRGVVR